MSLTKRNLVQVDPTIRKKIVTQIVFYWSACLVFSALPLIIGMTLRQPERLFVDHIGDMLRRYWPLYFVITAILPFAIRDALRIANRALGPLKRLRDELDSFRMTGVYNPVACRQDDFLHELFEEINKAIVSNQSAPQDSELAGTSV
jgi:hypothetical protein